MLHKPVSKPIFLFLAVCGVTMVSSVQTGTLPEDGLNFLYESGTEGYNCFRIPAIVTTRSGTLLAFAEGRRNGCSNTGDIDLTLLPNGDLGCLYDPGVSSPYHGIVFQTITMQ